MIFIPNKEVFETKLEVYDLDGCLLGVIYTELQLAYIQLQCRYLKKSLIIKDKNGKEFKLHDDGFFRDVPDQVFDLCWKFISCTYLTKDNYIDDARYIDSLVGDNRIENLIRNSLNDNKWTCRWRSFTYKGGKTNE